MTNEIQGAGVALVTPFHNGEIDWIALEKLVRFNIKKDIDFLVVLGTTGEDPTLSSEEKIEILERVAIFSKGKVPLVAGFSGNNTKALVETIKSFHFQGYSAILSASPSYNKPTQDGIFQHFMAVEKVSPVPIMLYNVPGRTGSNISTFTALRLANASKKFFAIKEASGDLPQILRLLKVRPKGFKVFSGDDLLATPIIAMGGDGLVSVLGNALPKEISKIVHLGLKGKIEKAAKCHLELLDLMHLIFVDGNPAGVKFILEYLKICKKELRLPLVDATPTTAAKIESALKGLGI